MAFPSPPKAPPPPPAPFNNISANVDAAQAQARQRALLAGDMSGTLTTSGQGVQNPTTPVVRSLLGV